jgi:hypothetical protein
MSSQQIQEWQIENLRDHPAEDVARLRYLLDSGAERKHDPRRPNFFEIHDRDRVFYIHVSPVTEQIIFLATWAHDAQASPALHVTTRVA